jgi:hypothetical protein
MWIIQVFFIPTGGRQPLSVREMRNSEVGYFNHASVSGPQEIGWFDITVDNTLIVHWEKEASLSGMKGGPDKKFPRYSRPRMTSRMIRRVWSTVWIGWLYVFTHLTSPPPRYSMTTKQMMVVSQIAKIRTPARPDRTWGSRGISCKLPTHVYLLFELVINDFQQTNDMAMSALFHDSNLLPDLVFCRTKFVGDSCVWRHRQVSAPHHGPLFGAGIVALDGLDGLKRVALVRELACKEGSKTELTTSRLLSLIS